MRSFFMRRTVNIFSFVLLLHGSYTMAQDSANTWKPLFDGKTLTGWRSYQNKPMNSWDVRDGILYNKGNSDTTLKHADLVTVGEFDNFQLNIDWKIAPQANSGILYLVSEAYPSSFQSGPEYQLIDDKGYPGKLENWQKTGANYAMDPPLADAAKPVGEWNRTVIIVNHGNVEHWLNNIKVAEYKLWSDTWKDHKAKGKWKDSQSYGTFSRGRIVLQDHGGEVWFKNIIIREL